MKIFKTYFSMDGKRQEESTFIIKGIFRKKVYLIEGSRMIEVKRG